jgi:glycosyltransferase involved in cell wall biosynthesis
MFIRPFTVLFPLAYTLLLLLAHPSYGCNPPLLTNFSAPVLEKQPNSPQAANSNRRQGLKKKDPQVLFIIPHLIMGGLERSFIDMLYFLRKNPHSYHICILNRGGLLETLLPYKAKIISLDRAKKNSYNAVVSYAQWIDPSLWVHRIKAKKYVQWLHADLNTIGETYPLHTKKGRKGIDVFVGVSKAASNSLIEMCPKLEKKTITIHNCVDEDEIVYRSTENQSEIVPNDRKLNVVTVCRISPEKGIERLIRVHSKLNKKGIDFRWYFVGSGFGQAELEKLAETEGLRGKVFFLGHKTNPYPYIKAADIFVLGSYSESWGLVITEAMVLQRPILSTHVAGAAEQISSGKNGLIVPNNEEGLYNGLAKLLQSEETRRQYSQALANFHYDNKGIIHQIKDLLFTETGIKKVKKKRANPF